MQGKRATPYETRRVIVADGLGVTERLEDGRRLQDHLLDLRALVRHRSEVLENQLGGL